MILQCSVRFFLLWLINLPLKIIVFFPNVLQRITLNLTNQTYLPNLCLLSLFIYERKTYKLKVALILSNFESWQKILQVMHLRIYIGHSSLGSSHQESCHMCFICPNFPYQLIVQIGNSPQHIIDNTPIVKCHSLLYSILSKTSSNYCIKLFCTLEKPLLFHHFQLLLCLERKC